jgi:hypothetical protein
MWLWSRVRGCDRPEIGVDVCAGGTGGSEAIFRVIQGTNVVFDAGAEGTKRVQNVGFESACGRSPSVVLEVGAEGTRRVQNVAVEQS